MKSSEETTDYRLQTTDHRLQWERGIMGVRDYRNVKAWQLADQFALEVYRATKTFPKEELYGLTSQLRRAAVSGAANIAEGTSRHHQKDCLQFLYISRGSLSEAEYLSSLGQRLGYLAEEDYKKLAALCDEAKATLFGLIRSVEGQI